LVKAGTVWDTSNPFDADGVRVGSQGAEVLDVGGKHDAPRLGTGHDHGVYCGAAPSEVAKFAGATGEGCRQILLDIARL
jgi:hypothetical protein